MSRPDILHSFRELGPVEKLKLMASVLKDLGITSPQTVHVSFNGQGDAVTLLNTFRNEPPETHTLSNWLQLRGYAFDYPECWLLDVLELYGDTEAYRELRAIFDPTTGKVDFEYREEERLMSEWIPSTDGIIRE